MKQVTPVIPIVIALNNDPVGAGLIASRAYALFYAAAELARKSLKSATFIIII